MPPPRQQPLTRGRKLVNICNQQQPKSSSSKPTDESPIPPDAEEPPSGWLAKKGVKRKALLRQNVCRKLSFKGTTSQTRGAVTATDTGMEVALAIPEPTPSVTLCTVTREGDAPVITSMLSKPAESTPPDKTVPMSSALLEAFSVTAGPETSVEGALVITSMPSKPAESTPPDKTVPMSSALLEAFSVTAGPETSVEGALVITSMPSKPAESTPPDKTVPMSSALLEASSVTAGPETSVEGALVITSMPSKPAESTPPDKTDFLSHQNFLLSQVDGNNNGSWKGVTNFNLDLDNILFGDESLNPIFVENSSVVVSPFSLNVEEESPDQENSVVLGVLTPVEVETIVSDFTSLLPENRHNEDGINQDDELQSNIDYDNISESDGGDTTSHWSSGEENENDENGQKNNENGQNNNENAENEQNNNNGYEENEQQIEEGMETPAPKVPCRKKVRRPKSWKKNVAKEKANSGKSYTSPTTGKVVRARAMRGPCACKKNCKVTLKEDARKHIFEKFWAIGDHTLQWDFISRHSTSCPVRKRTTTNPSSRRQTSRTYFFMVNSGTNRVKVPVCKTMFLNTLGIRQGWIDSAYSHLEGKTGAMSPDKRGRHSNRPTKLTEEQRATVHTHINKYPRTPSHYVRARSQREYLEWGLSMAKMFRHYKQWCEEEQIPKEARASQTKYRTIFNTEFNIGFFRPKKDRCALCQVMKTGTRRERARYEAKWVVHFRNKVAARKLKAEAKAMGVREPDTVNVMAFDMQKVLPVPKSEVSTFFYKNKLSLYNLSVFDMIQKGGYCYLWHEAIGKRGANEISSCVSQYVRTEAVAKGFKIIFSFSDSCSGQNKNRFFFAMMLQVAAMCSIDWTHTFLEPGHTQNENDSVHAKIESSAKLREIFDLEEWINIIKTAKEEEPMYKVKVMSQKDILDFHPLVDKHQNWKKSSDGKEIKWSKVKVLKASCTAIGELKFKYEYNGDWSTLNTKQGIVGRPVNLCTYKPRQAYAAKLQLQKKKQDHLKALCNQLDIPSKYHEFYFEVMGPAAETNNGDANDESCHENEENSSDDEYFRDTLTRIPDPEDAAAENVVSENEEDIENEGLQM